MDFSEFTELYNKILTDNRLDRFAGYARIFHGITECLINSTVNVTAIKDIPDIIALHFADSLLGERFVPKNANCVDVGAGGGFPSLPLSAVRQDIHMTALDSTGKKLQFIADTADKCNIGNIGILHRRAEEAFAADSDYREKFDCVTARAVAPLNVLCELCLPSVKPGGVFVAYRAAEGKAELDGAVRSVKMSGGEVAEIFDTTLRSQSGANRRYIIKIAKVSHTDVKYPRKYAKIVKSPL